MISWVKGFLETVCCFFFQALTETSTERGPSVSLGAYRIPMERGQTTMWLEHSGKPILYMMWLKFLSKPVSWPCDRSIQVNQFYTPCQWSLLETQSCAPCIVNIQVNNSGISCDWILLESQSCTQCDWST